MSARPEIFYFLDPSAAGQGLATEAIHAFLLDVEDRFDVAEIVAKVFTDNPASAAILEKLGFHCAGERTAESAQRVEPAPVWLYRLSLTDIGAYP